MSRSRSHPPAVVKVAGPVSEAVVTRVRRLGIKRVERIARPPLRKPERRRDAPACELTGTRRHQVGLNPCRTVHYVINRGPASAQLVGDVHGAFRALGRATGIRFVFDRTTGEKATGGRAPVQARYGRRWAPILIDLSSPELTGAGTTLTRVGGVTVSAAVTLDPQVWKRTPTGFGPGLTTGAVLLHELGHVAGLEHVGQRRQVMHPLTGPARRGPAVYSAGDLAGLRKVGRAAGCLREPALPR